MVLIIDKIYHLKIKKTCNIFKEFLRERPNDLIPITVANDNINKKVLCGFTGDLLLTVCKKTIL